MKLRVLVCLSLLCVASSEDFTPRGARPVEPATRSEKCASQKEWPFCTDDDWGHKCPSGCRIQGLMDKYDHSVLKKIEKIRSLLDQNRVSHRSTDQVSKQTYDYLKDKLTTDADHDNSYYDVAQNLRERITDMKIKIDRQLRILAALKDRVKDQVLEMQRLEVDIDIKLRSCKGSCSSYSEYQVDKESYVALGKQINQLDAQSIQSIESVRTLYVMKSKDMAVEKVFKSASGALTAAQKTEDVFPDVKNVQLILDSEGSPASPATITKDPGTSYSASTSSSSSSSSSTSSSSSSSSSSSKTITELGSDSHLFGTGFGSNSQPSMSHTTTKSITCTKSIRRTTVQTSSGPEEKVEEVIEGGPECHVMTDTSGGMKTLFPSLSHTSSSTTKTFHSTSSKGSITGGDKTGFPDLFSSDIHGFLTDDPEEDVPDVHARSVKSVRVERQADYIGKVCVRLKQQKQDGRQPLSQTQRYRKQQCRAESDVALCSDDDWVSKCPSGCRLHGLISQMESDVERKLWKVCKTAKLIEDAAETSMTVMTQTYNSNRRVIINRYMSELKFLEGTKELSQTLRGLRKRSTSLSHQLEKLHINVQKQIEDLYRTEVDIDMKLRACQGSCRSVLPFTVDHTTYRKWTADMDQINKAGIPPEDIAHILMQTVDVSPALSAEYKSIPAVQRELLTQFEDIGQNEFILEELLDPVDVDVPKI